MIAIMSSPLAFADDKVWETASPPEIVSRTPSGQTLKVKIGSSVNIRVRVEDIDKYTIEGEECVDDVDEESEDSAGFKLTLQGEGSLSNTSWVSSGTGVSYVAPEVMPNQKMVTIKIDGNDGHESGTGVTPPETGDRNDPSLQMDSIQIELVDTCPQISGGGNHCSANNPDPDAIHTWGYDLLKMTAGPGEENWDGHVVTERLSQQSSTCPSSVVGACNGSGSFTIGEPASGTGGCNGPATPNTFYDNHATVSPSSVLVDGQSCTISCKQEYLCGENVVGTFTVLRTFTGSSRQIIVDGTPLMFDVTNVTHTK